MIAHIQGKLVEKNPTDVVQSGVVEDKNRNLEFS